METSNSKEEVLKRVRQALGKGDHVPHVPDLSKPVLKEFQESDLSIVFAESFLKTKGIFFFCENERELAQNLEHFIQSNNLSRIFAWEKSLFDLLSSANIKFSLSEREFEKAEAGITTCEALIARTGSIFVSSGTEAGRRLSIYPHIHIVVGYTSQIVKEIVDGLNLIRNRYKNRIPSMLSCITGPSRTADIEKTLVLGAHGPKDLVLFLIDDTSN